MEWFARQCTVVPVAGPERPANGILTSEGRAREIMTREGATRHIGGAAGIALAPCCGGTAHAATICDARSYGAEADGSNLPTCASNEKRR